MRRRPPRSTRTDTLFPYTTLFRSNECSDSGKISGNDFAVAHERHFYHFGRQPLAADFNLDGIARLGPYGQTRHAYGNTHGRRHGAAGQFALALLAADFHVTAHDTAFQQLDAYQLAVDCDGFQRLAADEAAIGIFKPYRP